MKRFLSSIGIAGVVIAGLTATGSPTATTPAAPRQSARTAGWRSAAGKVNDCRVSRVACRPSKALQAGLKKSAARFATSERTGTATLADAPLAGTTPIACDPSVVDVPGALCGTLAVPQDRSEPDGPSFDIAYEIYLHTGDGPAKAALMANPGGPGQATTSFRGFYLYAFEPLLVDHDLVLIDDRGRGFSGHVDCPQVQHGTSDWFGNLGKCADQLSAAGTIDNYATGDIADDTDAVRAALGYDKLAYYGVSSGAVDVEAYALRYPEHLRAIVLDSPWTSQNYTVDTNTMMRGPFLDRVRLVCAGSQACTPTASSTADQIAWLAHRLAKSPLAGSALDANGVQHDIVLDEAGFIARILADDSSAFVNQGEIAAAIAAFRTGDRAPLLRIAAEMDYGWPADAGPASEFSVGDAFAVMCSEQDWQWDRDASVESRKEQYAAYIAQTPKSAIAPFSRTGFFEGARELYASGDTCIEWPTTHANLPIPPHATYPNVPTLVLTSDLDVITPVSTGTVAPRWPNSTFVNVHGIGHATLFWGDCTLGMVRQFLATLDAGDTSCADAPSTAWWAVGRFPATMDEALAARPADLADRSGGRERRAATVATQTVVDAFKRLFRSDGSAPIPGLRGGNVIIGSTPGGDTRIDLAGARFTRDLAVSGTAVWTDVVSADLQLSGAATGTVHVSGVLLGGPGSATWRVTGQINGRTVVLDTVSA